MTSDHVAVALLAGTFRWKDSAHPTALTRTADGVPFVEFQVQTTEQRNDHRVRTSHLASALGPLALRITTTFDSGDLVVVSGDLRTPHGCRLPAISLDVRIAFRMPAAPMGTNTQGLNVAYVVGTAREATRTRFRDGTPATLVTVACASPPPDQRVNHHTVVLRGPIPESARTIARGDIIRVDGPIGVHDIGRERVWAFTCEHLRILERFPERTPLLAPTHESLQRTG